eukprot:767663-Hanusia_phi.AAC.1
MLSSHPLSLLPASPSSLRPPPPQPPPVQVLTSAPRPYSGKRASQDFDQELRSRLGEALGATPDRSLASPERSYEDSASNAGIVQEAYTPVRPKLVPISERP